MNNKDIEIKTMIDGLAEQAKNAQSHQDFFKAMHTFSGICDVLIITHLGSELFHYALNLFSEVCKRDFAAN